MSTPRDLSTPFDCPSPGIDEIETLGKWTAGARPTVSPGWVTQSRRDPLRCGCRQFHGSPASWHSRRPASPAGCRRSVRSEHRRARCAHALVRHRLAVDSRAAPVVRRASIRSMGPPGGQSCKFRRTTGLRGEVSCPARSKRPSSGSSSDPAPGARRSTAEPAQRRRHQELSRISDWGWCSSSSVLAGASLLERRDAPTTRTDGDQRPSHISRLRPHDSVVRSGRCSIAMWCRRDRAARMTSTSLMAFCLVPGRAGSPPCRRACRPRRGRPARPG